MHITEMTASAKVKAAKTDWRAGVELLARRFPKEYAKPETQTAITQVNFNAVPPR
jgi:hypothetical protein